MNDRADGTARAPRDSHQRAGTRSILIVEDEEVVAEGLSAVLELEGHATVVATSCAAARRLVRARPFAAMIVDVGLPDGDGIEMLKAMRRAGIRTPAIVSTGHESARLYMERVSNARFLLKPYTAEELMRALGSLSVARSPERITRHAGE